MAGQERYIYICMSLFTQRNNWFSMAQRKAAYVRSLVTNLHHSVKTAEQVSVHSSNDFFSELEQIGPGFRHS